MKRKKTAWYRYQENVASVFRSLGHSATTNETIEGVRAKHNVDVVVRSNQAGFPVLWIVECKHWRRAVPKATILSWRAIIDDLGADKGFVLAENGYQSGALSAARLTNIELVSLEELKEIANVEIGKAKLWSLVRRAQFCADRYWELDKDDRIEHQLRPDPGDCGYSSFAIFRAVEITARHALLHGLPVGYDRTTAVLSAATGSTKHFMDPESGDIYSTYEELCDALDAEIAELERRITDAETALRRTQNVVHAETS